MNFCKKLFNFLEWTKNCSDKKIFVTNKACNKQLSSVK